MRILNINMNKFKKIRKILLLITFSCFLTAAYFIIFYIESTRFIAFDFSKIKLVSFNESKEEWQIINDNIYIRLNTAMYLQDDKQMTIVIQIDDKKFGNNMKHLKFAFNIEIFDAASKLSLARFDLHDIKMRRLYNNFGIHNVQLYALLDLNAKLHSSPSIDRLHTKIDLPNRLEMRFLVSVQESSTKQTFTTLDSIKVDIKNRLSSSRDIYFCTEPVYFEKESSADMQWFVGITSQIGFNKIIITNNSIPNTNELNNLFEKNNNFVEIIQLHQLPNLVKPQLNKKYLHHIQADFGLDEQPEWTGSSVKFVASDNLAYNECLLRNTDKASLIFVGDYDEVFIPSKLTRFDTNRDVFQYLMENVLENDASSQIEKFKDTFLNSCKKSKSKESTYLRDYIDENLYGKHGISPDLSLYFAGCMYLKENLTEEIFQKLDLTLKKITNGSTSSFPLKANVYHKHDAVVSQGFNFSSPAYDNIFTITINNPAELNYAKNLLSLYRYLIKPFLVENNHLLKSGSERLTRILYMDDRVPGLGFLGKTFANTKTAQFMESPHSSKGPSFKDLHNRYFISHFRDRYWLGGAERSITHYNFDLNYFACYVKPMVQNLKLLKDLL